MTTSYNPAFAFHNLRTSGFPPAPFQSQDAGFSKERFHLRSATFDLPLTLKESGGYERLKGETAVTVRRDMVENPNGYAWSMKREQVARTGHQFRTTQFTSLDRRN